MVEWDEGMSEEEVGSSYFNGDLLGEEKEGTRPLGRVLIFFLADLLVLMPTPPSKKFS